jgi:nicotinamidase-related amidase
MPQSQVTAISLVEINTWCYPSVRWINRKSANSDLCITILQTQNIKYLLFLGIASNVCVESTLRDAYFHEYFPILVSDGCGNLGPDYTQEATIWNVSEVFGWVTTSIQLLKVLK